MTTTPTEGPQIAEWAEIFTLPADPDVLLPKVSPGLRLRYKYVLKRFERELEYSGVLHHYLTPELLDSPVALFSLTHSSFEDAFDDLAVALKSNPDKVPLIVKVIRERVTHALERIKGKLSEPAVYQVIDDSHIEHTFPLEGIFQRISEGREFELLDTAKERVEAWQPALAKEIDFYVRNSVFWWTDKPAFSSMGRPASPGHVTFVPNELFGKWGEMPDEIVSILFAASLVHETYHQKAYFLTRAIDPTPDLFPTPLIKRGNEKISSPFLFGHMADRMHDLMLSVAHDHLFLRYAMETFPLGKYESYIERLCEEKKTNILKTVTFAESNREILTPLGEKTLDRILLFLQELN